MCVCVGGDDAGDGVVGRIDIFILSPFLTGGGGGGGGGGS